MVPKVSDDQKQLQEPAFKALPRERQALIIDAAYRLGRYCANGLERDTERSQRSFELLRDQRTLHDPGDERPGLARERPRVAHRQAASAPGQPRPSANTACAWPTTTSTTTVKVSSRRAD